MGERLASRTHAHPRSMVPNGLPSTLYFGGPLPHKLLRLVLVDPTYRYLKSVGCFFSHVHEDSLSPLLVLILHLIDPSTHSA